MYTRLISIHVGTFAELQRNQTENHKLIKKRRISPKENPVHGVDVTDLTLVMINDCFTNRLLGSCMEQLKTKALQTQKY